MNRFDCIVIGIGPCGIQAAIQLKRLGVNVLAIGNGYGALAKASIIENYYGIREIKGIDLALASLKQATDLGVLINKDEVLEIIPNTKDFLIKTSKSEYIAKTIMLAVGKSRNQLTIAKRFEGKGVSYCASCDGFFYRKKKVAVIGEGRYMANELAILANLGCQITVFTNGNELDCTIDSSIPVEKEKITALIGEDFLQAIQVKDKEYQVSGAFIALGTAGAFSLAKHLGLALNKDSIVVDNNFMTNIKGIFAGGDAIGGLLQVSKAVGDGIIAANKIFKYLNAEKE